MFGKKGKRIGTGIALGCILTQLYGCRATELEDRSFPMMAAVEYDSAQEEVGFTYIFPVLHTEPDAAEDAGAVNVAMEFAPDFIEAWDNYEKSMNKVADYNHLKVFLMSESFLENQTQYERMLTMIQEEETFPRNTYVCVTDDMQAVLDTQSGLVEDLGTYIEELLENHEYGKDSELPTLGNLIDEKENHRREWNIPYLTVENDTILWSGSYSLGKKNE